MAIEIHQFVIQTKENPVNYTREEVLDVDGLPTGETEVTANTEVLTFVQERPTFDAEGNVISEGQNRGRKLTDYPQNIQDAAMTLFGLVKTYEEAL